MKVMILGANGLCGTSLVPMLDELFPAVDKILIDPSDESGPRIIRASPEVKDLWHVIPSFGLRKGDVLIDLTTALSKLDVIQAADALGVSVINATMCEQDRGSLSMVDILDKKLLLASYEWQAGHLMGCGMNPGNINAMLGAMVEKFGKPLEVTEWEMDSTLPYNWDGEGFATWSPTEFAGEWGDESTWEMDGKNVMWADGPPVDNLWTMPDGNIGTLCQHEELMTWAWNYGCKARYLYGFSKQAMEKIAANIRNRIELPLCRKLEGRVPTGEDYIALKVRFKQGTANGAIWFDNADKRIPIGSNATSYLVACGIATALNLLHTGLPKGINLPDAHGVKWMDFIKKNDLCDVEMETELKPISEVKNP